MQSWEGASSQAYREIRERILDGRYPGGSRLREQSLASELQISRTPVRSALIRLQEEGLIDLTANQGARVIAWTPKDIEEAFDLRAILEGWGAARATLHATPEQLERLNAACTSMEGLIQLQPMESIEIVAQLAKLNQVFHDTVAEASGSPKLPWLRKNLVSLPIVEKAYFSYSTEQLRSAVQDHRAIFRAIERRNAAEAESLMRAHIFRGRDSLVSIPMATAQSSQ
jgi:DNA-binding GntR family transcriptional regulator